MFPFAINNMAPNSHKPTRAETGVEGGWLMPMVGAVIVRPLDHFADSLPH
jgi:hypothetical protein